jgi:hypothetical protein
VETMNGVFGDARSFPIVNLIEHMVKYQRQNYYEKYLQGCKWSEEGRHTTDYCRDIQLKITDDASRRTVEIVESNHPSYRARVQSTLHGTMGYIEVCVNLERWSSKCPCRYYSEMGITCVHVKALLHVLKQQSTWCAP